MYKWKPFNILYHIHPIEENHFDLLLDNFLEKTEKLLTFRIENIELIKNSLRFIKIERLKDHRRIYLFYEGPISNNRGKVIRYTSGRFIYAPKNEGEFFIFFSSKKFFGSFILKNDEKDWFIKKL